jgi:hypothetical protein
MEQLKRLLGAQMNGLWFKPSTMQNRDEKEPNIEVEQKLQVF